MRVAADVARRKVDPIETDGLCQCGCGQPAPLADKSSGELRAVAGMPRRFISGHNSRGMKRGEGRIVRDGYVFIHVGGNRYVGEHRLVMERIVGRRLERWEHVHHRNHVRDDNRPGNLEIVNWSEHGTKHGHPEGVPLSTEHRRKLSESQRRAWAKRKAAHQ